MRGKCKNIMLVSGNRYSNSGYVSTFNDSGDSAIAYVDSRESFSVSPTLRARVLTPSSLEDLGVDFPEVRNAKGRFGTSLETPLFASDHTTLHPINLNLSLNAEPNFERQLILKAPSSAFPLYIEPSPNKFDMEGGACLGSIRHGSLSSECANSLISLSPISMIQSKDFVEHTLIPLFHEDLGEGIIEAEPLQMRAGRSTEVMGEDRLARLNIEDQRAQIANTIQKKRWIRDAMGHVGRSIGLSFGDHPEDFLALFHCIESRGRPLSASKSPRTAQYRSGKNKELQSLLSTPKVEDLGRDIRLYGERYHGCILSVTTIFASELAIAPG
ncbi:uncharacterized protein LOC131217146 [Magnolia sinica]|uniref:uncharacterized protein LOC131217146 n=1 Tax=Magnolia sinica TaxID=86752 RepID=UPI00265A1AB0|nr:uncharacterized protein LOC131217146 [Magnolia sinica]